MWLSQSIFRAWTKTKILEDEMWQNLSPWKDALTRVDGKYNSSSNLALNYVPVPMCYWH